MALPIPNMAQPEIAADSVEVAPKTSVVDMLRAIGDTDLELLLKSVSENIIHFALNVVLSLLIYYVGRWVLNRAIKIIDLAFDRHNVEVTIRSFARSLIKTVFYIILIIIIVQILGVDTTSLVAMLASAGLAIGMALSGTLQNFAGGVMVLFLKPYKVGDYITSQGESGIVKEIMLFTTVLETFDRHTIFVPNSAISSSIIDNATFADTRRVEWKFGITYGDSVDEARRVILEIMGEDRRILNDTASRASLVSVEGLGDSSVNLFVRGWVKTDDYWNVLFDTYEKIYKRLPERGLHFPFPQMDIHIKR
ncbi:MAG: mechanosensitive ion channel family protein [Rikenellaceae bacterium]